MDTMFNDHRPAWAQATWTESDDFGVVSGIRPVSHTISPETLPSWDPHAARGVTTSLSKSSPDVGYPYEVVELIGKGAMGSIWRGFDRRLMREVAIKVAHKCAGAGTCFLEARLAARAEHPHVVHIYDVGLTRQGAAFLVMELLHGRDLGAVLAERGRMSCEQAVDIALPLLSGLDAAHRAGVLHRDLKPSNVFLSQMGHQRTVKLLDFGVACRPRQGSVESIVGTPLYMAPEQLFAGAPASVRTDVFGAAAILFQMITGTQLCSTDWSRASLCELAQARDLSPLARRCEGTLRRIVERGLASCPEHRFSSASAFRHALESWRRTGTSAAA